MAEPSPSNPAEGARSHGGGGDGGDGNSSVREQDRFLPIANITRILKRALPKKAKVSKEAKETIQECVSEFISFITSEAIQRCMKESRQKINGDDVLLSMEKLGLDDYIEPLKLYLDKYRQSEGRAPHGGQGSAKGEMGGSHPNTNTTKEYQFL